MADALNGLPPGLIPADYVDVQALGRGSFYHAREGKQEPIEYDGAAAGLEMTVEYDLLEPYHVDDRTGLGLRCKRDIQKGERVVEFVGEVLDDTEVVQKYDESIPPRVAYYLMTLGDNASLSLKLQRGDTSLGDTEMFVDQQQWGNKARFANDDEHKPNMQVCYWPEPVRAEDGSLDETQMLPRRAYLRAIRRIPAGVELRYSYGAHYDRFWKPKDLPKMAETIARSIIRPERTRSLLGASVHVPATADRPGRMTTEAEAVEAALLEALPEAPTLRPTAEEFVDPVAYIEAHQAHAQRFGLFKIVPPPGWVPARTFPERFLARPLYSRSATAPRRKRARAAEGAEGAEAGAPGSADAPSEPHDGRDAQQRQQPVTTAAVAAAAAAADTEALAPTAAGGSSAPAADGSGGAGRDFCAATASYAFTMHNPGGRSSRRSWRLDEWRRLCSLLEQQVASAIAMSGVAGADLSEMPLGGLFYSLFGATAGAQALGAPEIYYGPELRGAEAARAISPWDLSKLPRAKGSLLGPATEPVAGVTAPALRMGMLFASRGWAAEPCNLYSACALHSGASVSWFGVPAASAFELERALVNHAFDRTARDARQIAAPQLVNGSAHVSPIYLRALGVPCCRLVQREGEIVVSLPYAYTTHVCRGFSVSECVRFALPSWAPLGMLALRRMRWLRAQTPIAIDRLIVEAVAERLGSFTLDQLQPLLHAARYVALLELRWRRTGVAARAHARDARAERPQRCAYCHSLASCSWLECRACACAPLCLACVARRGGACDCDTANAPRVLAVRVPEATLRSLVELRSAHALPTRPQLALEMPAGQDPLLPEAAAHVWPTSLTELRESALPPTPSLIDQLMRAAESAAALQLRLAGTTAVARGAGAGAGAQAGVAHWPCADPETRAQNGRSSGAAEHDAAGAGVGAGAAAVPDAQSPVTQPAPPSHGEDIALGTGPSRNGHGLGPPTPGSSRVRERLIASGHAITAIRNADATDFK